MDRTSSNCIQLAILMIAGLFASTSFAIKCYVCQSNVDPKCADPFDNLTLPITDCDSYPRADLVPKTEYELNPDRGFFSSFGQTSSVKPLRATMCRKIRQKVNGEWRTIRGCGYLGSPGDTEADQLDTGTGAHCTMRHGTFDVFMESCACNNKDGCNGAILGSSVNNWMLIPMVIALMIYTFVASLTNTQS